MRMPGRLRPALRRAAVEPTTCHDLKAWAAAYPGATYRPLTAPQTASRPLPTTIEASVDPSFHALCSYPVPERALVSIPGARLRGEPGLVILPGGQFVGELVAVTVPGREEMLRATPAYSTALPRRASRYPGDFYPLIGLGFNNYYHVTHDMVMSLLAVTPHLPAGTQLIIAEHLPRFAEEVMKVAGLDRFRWIRLPADALWELETLHVASPLNKTPYDTAEHFAPYCEMALARYGARSGKRARRIYVTRRDDAHWRALNENEVVEFLAAKGFEIISPKSLSVPEQIALFSQADLVVGTGAGMNNAMFAPRGARIVQLQEPLHVTHTLWTLAAARGLEYSYFLCDAVANPGGANVDIVVSIEKLEAAIAPL